MRANILHVVLAIAAIVTAGPISEDDKTPYTNITQFSYGKSCSEYTVVSGQSGGLVAEKNINICDDKRQLVGRDINAKFAAEAVYYNGSLSFSAVPGTFFNQVPGSGCPFTWTTHLDASLAIGDMVLSTDPKVTRTEWDSNPFYFALDYGNHTAYATQTNNASWAVNFESSTPALVWGQAWTLTSKKNGDGFDISGKVTTKKANYINSWTYGRYCGSVSFHDSSAVVSVNDYVSMTGRITPLAANLKFTIGNGTYYTETLEFSGSWWSAGPKLLVNGSDIQAEGSLKVSAGDGAVVTSKSVGAAVMAVLVSAAVLLVV